MLYCEHCDKEVLIFGEGSIAGMDDELDEWEKEMEEKGKIILYNPKPSSSYFCPVCHNELVEKE
ncbi:MAG: hypothetical protein P8Y70_02550 [Candidatus Lokiarchaeota archaeon]